MSSRNGSTTTLRSLYPSTVDALLMELPQERLFSDGEARVERVYLDPLFLQATGAK